MDREARVKMLKAMEFVCRQLNDENYLYEWLAIGVADGDIEYGDLSVTPVDMDLENDTMNFYTEDSNFQDIMDTFLYLMSKAEKNGGLYCDGLISKELIAE